MRPADIGVVVVSHNSASTLEDCIGRLLAQSLRSATLSDPVIAPAVKITPAEAVSPPVVEQKTAVSKDQARM